MITPRRIRLPSLTVSGAPTHTNGLTSKRQAFLINDDLKPVPPQLRTWSAFNYVSFWVADGFNLSSMMIASTSVSAGLAWWQAWLAVWIGYGLVAFFIAAQGRTAAVHHIGFPVLARSSFGVFGSLWPVLNRIVLAVVWYAYQSWVGGQCMKLILRSWAPAWGNASAPMSGTTVHDFVSFFLFWLVSFPCVCISPQKVKHLFTVKAAAMPVAAFALLGWSVSKAGGIGPIVHQPSKLSGSELGWAFVYAVTSQCSNMVTLAVNEPDFARLAKRRSDVVVPQLLAIPITFSITSLIGILISSSSTVIFGTETWDPLDILAQLLDRTPTDSATRAGVFFIAVAFLIAQIGTNVAANSLSAGSDLAAMMPRYLSIRRGGILCAAIALAVCPWHFFASTSSFTTYLSAYSVLLSPILGVMIADSYFVRRGKINVPSLFSAAPEGAAWYFKGLNWRAFAAYLIGCALNLPGFIAVIKTDSSVPMGLTRVYQLAFFTGSLSSAFCYVLFNEVSPVSGGISVRAGGKRYSEPRPDEELDFDGTPFALVQEYGAAQQTMSHEESGLGGRQSESEEGKEDKEKPRVEVLPFKGDRA